MNTKRGLITLILLLLVAFQGMAFAAPGDTVLFEQDSDVPSDVYIEAAVCLEGTLYITDYDNLYTYKLGDEAPVKGIALRKEMPDVIVQQSEPVPVDSIEEPAAEAAEVYNWNDRLCFPFVYQGKLHMINEATFNVWVLEGDAFSETSMKFEKPKGDEGYGVTNFVLKTFEFEGKLYALVRVDLENWDTPPELWVMNLENGTHEVLETGLPIKGITAYTPGKLLCVARHEYGTLPGEYKEEDYFPRMYVLDAATGKPEGDGFVIGGRDVYDVCGPVYDENIGILYTVKNTLIRTSSPDAKGEVISYFSRELYSGNGSMGILAPSHVVIPTYEGIYIRGATGDAVTGGTLKIANDYMGDAASAFMKANPEIPIEFVSEDNMYGASVDEIALMIGSGENEIDIFSLYESPTIAQLMEKGYALDLSSSEVLARAYERMYEPVRNAMMSGGKPMAFPRSVWPGLWQYNKEKFEEFGLKYPETMIEYIDLYEDWTYNLKGKYPSTFLTEDHELPENDVKMQLFYQVLYKYVEEAAVPGEPLSFNSPELIETLKRVDALPGEYKHTDNLSYSFGGDDDIVLLLKNYFQLENYGGDYGADTPAYQPRVLKSSEPAVTLSMQYYIVNPNSKNVDKALKFLEFMAENGEYTTRIVMYPDFNEPQKDPWGARDLENAEKYLAEAKEVKVTDENRRDVEQNIKDAERWLEQAKDRLWRVKQETIDGYRAVVKDRLRLSEDSYSALFGSSENANKQITSLIERYTDGQMGVEQLVRELDQKMQMIFYEQQ